MAQVDPSIIEGKYPPKKGGKKRTPYFLVKCRGLPKDRESPNGVYQKKHPTRIEAEKDRQRLIRLHGGGGLNLHDFQDAELAAHKLQTCEGDAKGKSLIQAVEWFIAHYRNESNLPTVEVCVEKFLAAKRERNPRPATMEEIERYLSQFKARFAQHPIDGISEDNRNKHLHGAAQKHRHRRFKFHDLQPSAVSSLGASCRKLRPCVFCGEQLRDSPPYGHRRHKPYCHSHR